MFHYDAERFVPQYLLNDKNGLALAKAMEAAMNMMNDIVLKGLRTALDYDYMPEWRLDELAWEMNCLYDYGADIEAKRRWIKNSFSMYRLYGTPESFYQYISSYFDDMDLEEWWQYNASPYHFRVTVEGIWNPVNEAWARKAIRTAKNARSVLDGLRIGTKIYLALTGEGAVLARFHYPMTGPENWTGRWPQENMIGIIDRSGRAAVSSEEREYRHPYIMTGTVPNTATEAVLDYAQAGFSGEAKGKNFEYPFTGEDRKAGTEPREIWQGVVDKSGFAGLAAIDREQVFPYPQAGTRPEESTIGQSSEARAGVTGEATDRRFPYPQAGTIPDINTEGITGEQDIQAAQAVDTYTAIAYKLCGADEI